MRGVGGWGGGGDGGGGGGVALNYLMLFNVRPTIRCEFLFVQILDMI